MEADLFFENDLGVDLSGIPSSYELDITNIPKITIGLDPITIQPSRHNGWTTIEESPKRGLP